MNKEERELYSLLVAALKASEDPTSGFQLVANPWGELSGLETEIGDRKANFGAELSGFFPGYDAGDGRVIEIYVVVAPSYSGGPR